MRVIFTRKNPSVVCRALWIHQGKFAREGEFSFVEQGGESKRPGKETIKIQILSNLHSTGVNNARASAGQTRLGAALFAYFFSLKRKSKSLAGETNTKNQQHFE